MLRMKGMRGRRGVVLKVFILCEADVSGCLDGVSLAYDIALPRLAIATELPGQSLATSTVWSQTGSSALDASMH